MDLSENSTCQNNTTGDETTITSNKQTRSSDSSTDTNISATLNTSTGGETTISSNKESSSSDASTDNNNVFRRSEKTFSHTVIFNLLTLFDSSTDVHTDELDKPKGGSVIFFYSTNETKKGKYSKI